MKCLIICGLTSSNKSALAEKISQNIAADIINADSQQIYRNLKNITAQPTLRSNYYLYGFQDIEDLYSSFQWAQSAEFYIQNSIKNNRLPILVGGSGFYIRNLLEGHMLRNDPSTRYNFCKNVEFKTVILMPPKELIFQKTLARIKNTFDDICNEVREEKSEKINRVIGGYQTRSYLKGLIDANTCIQRIHCATMQYAKRQRTWFTHQINGVVSDSIDVDKNLSIIENLIYCK